MTTYPTQRLRHTSYSKNSRRLKKMATAALSLSLVVGLAACEGQVPSVQSTDLSSASSLPDMTPAQEKKIRTDILQSIEQANVAKDPSSLEQVMSGPALDIRTSQINISKVTGELNKTATIPKKMTQTVIPTDSGWPRSVFTITTTTEDQQSKRLLVLEQDNARSNYKLWAVTRLFEGAKLPKFTVPSIGSQMGKTNDKGLVTTPEQAVQWYADVLQNGSSSKYSSKFADDSFRTALDQVTQTVQQGAEQNKGTQAQTFEPVTGAISVMRSADGGDLVVAQINSQWTRQFGEGRESLPASNDEKALFADTKATSTMKVTYVNVFTIYVPPAKSKQLITAVGAERQPIKVEAL